MDKKVSTECAMRTAFASARMEGFRVTPEIERDCRRIIEGKATLDECVRKMIAGPDDKRRR